jgi:hypothetical protein
MFYLVHLALPALVVLAMVIAGPAPEMNMSGLEQALEHFALSYMAFASPHWIWASISAYFEASESPTVGGFVGLHLLLVATTLMVFMSHAPEAANAWFLYFLGAPIAITLGALARRYIASWKKNPLA